MKYALMVRNDDLSKKNSFEKLKKVYKTFLFMMKKIQILLFQLEEMELF